MQKKTQSYGVIAVKLFDYKLRFLVIQKRNTYEFVDMLRGLYDPNDDKSVIRLLEGMTFQERTWIALLPYDVICHVTWLTTEKFSSYQNGQAKLETLRSKKNFDELINTPVYKQETDWEFPKGRKAKIAEKEYECAIREFCEETGCEQIQLLKEVDPVTVDFIGTDYRKYSVTYYFAYCFDKPFSHLKANKRQQACEVMKTDWISKKEIEKKLGGKLGKRIQADVESKYKKICDFVGKISMTQNVKSLFAKEALM